MINKTLNPSNWTGPNWTDLDKWTHIPNSKQDTNPGQNMVSTKLIYACESAKDVWNILQNTHEGTTLVKISKL